MRRDCEGARLERRGEITENIRVTENSTALGDGVIASRRVPET